MQFREKGSKGIEMVGREGLLPTCWHFFKKNLRKGGRGTLSYLMKNKIKRKAEEGEG